MRPCFLRMKMLISFSIFTFRDVCPCQTTPLQQAGTPDNPVSPREKGRHGCVLRSPYLLATSEPSMPRDGINVPFSWLTLSYGVLQKFRQMHTDRSFVCTHLHMTQGAFLLLDLHILKTKDNTGALQTDKAPSVCIIQTGNPDHSTLLTFGLWKEQLCTNFQTPGCSAPNFAKGKQRDGEIGQRLLGPLSPQSSATALHNTWSSCRKGKVSSNRIWTDSPLEILFKIGKMSP